jgi:hypothetical protein
MPTPPPLERMGRATGPAVDGDRVDHLSHRTKR